jgi:protein O-GlcNAc transferase
VPVVTIPQAFDLAVQHHRAGRLAEADALYRQILAVQPNHADALHLLGAIAHQVGRDEFAVECIRRAIGVNPAGLHYYIDLGNALATQGQLDEAGASYRRALQFRPDYPEAHINLGNVLRDQGRIDEAIASYRRALQLKPSSHQAHNSLGNAFRDRGQIDEAIASYRRALQFEPNYPHAHNNLGNALKDLGHLDEAIASYRRALQLKPDFPHAHHNLGNALRDRGRLDEAIASFHSALEVKPDLPEAHANLGNALSDLGRLDEADASYRRALQFRPDYSEVHTNLGNVLRNRGKVEEAITSYRRALQLKPDSPEAHNNLGNALRDRGQIDEAMISYRRAIELKPDYPEAHNNLGLALGDIGRLDEALASCQSALQLKPHYPEANNNLANVLKDSGRLDEAIESYRHAVQLKPGDARFHSNLVYTLGFHPGYGRVEIAEERRRWNRQFSDPLKRFILPHTNDRSPNRRLRVGYVSPDLRDHVTGRYLIPLFERHDRERFEILCYSGVLRPDKLTEEFRQHTHQWRSTVGVSDEALVEMIREDGVDILVDLSQHLAGNRLPAFARKPAPVQVSFAGYPDSAGLEAIGYRISDRYLEAGSAGEESERRERVCLIDSFWCYDPCGVEVKINDLPARGDGRVTFGCLNNFCKVNERVLRLWARVLGKVRESRLVVASYAGSHRERTLEVLGSEGVERRRVEFVEYRPRREYLELHHGLDIVLDTFPYNGHTTSLDALWMGVPVVSLAGETAVSRAGLSQLTNLGLPELVAHSEAEYVSIARNLARDLARLAGLRATLRARMEDSPLMDAPRFARNVEAAYRSMWERWNMGQPSARKE